MHGTAQYGDDLWRQLYAPAMASLMMMMMMVLSSVCVVCNVHRRPTLECMERCVPDEETQYGRGAQSRRHPPRRMLAIAILPRVYAGVTIYTTPPPPPRTTWGLDTSLRARRCRGLRRHNSFRGEGVFDGVPMQTC